MDAKSKAMYFKHIAQVRELKIYEPEERMRRWKEIFESFENLSLSLEAKQKFVGVSETLLKAKFSGTSLQLFETVVSDIKVNLKPFSLEKFALKLKNKYTAENGLVDYSKLELVALKVIQQAPSFQFVKGIDLFSEIEVPQKRARIKRPKDPEQDKIKPSNVVNKKSDMPDNEIAVVLNALKKAHVKQNQRPVIYWLLITDPASFQKTVLNIFYVSFLIKESLAKFSLDKDNILTIEPVLSAKKDDKSKHQEIKKSHAFISINKQMWMDLIGHFNIKKPMIVWDK